MDDNALLPFTYGEIICTDDEPREVVPVLLRTLLELDPVAAKSLKKEFRYAQRRGYDIENLRVERLLDTLFELLDPFATDYDAIFGRHPLDGSSNSYRPGYAFIQVDQ